ncbi:MLP-like protein 34 [Tripterygium wilfordii]|uniref:MLP-like protein 34 n=1 Tax=Tripterygium wilfordii TaxID=458696 RepID=UPI0018F844D3|nr:MLP-like protein 34 [Tripterygium wilfordii]
MSVHGKMEAELEVKVSAAQFHEVFSFRPHHISNMTPDHIQGVDLHEGEWGKQGKVISWNYVHDGVPKVAKERVEAIDDVNNSTSFRVIEGDILNEYKDFLITVQATPKGQGSLVKWTFEYEKLKPDVPDPQSLLNFVVTVSKGIDDHHTTTTAAAYINGALLAPHSVRIVNLATMILDYRSTNVNCVLVCDWNTLYSTQVVMDIELMLPPKNEPKMKPLDITHCREDFSICGHFTHAQLSRRFVVPNNACPLEGQRIYWNYSSNSTSSPPLNALSVVLLNQYFLKMSVHGKMEAELEVKVSAAQFHEVFSFRPHHISNMTPDHIQGVDLHEGEWGKQGKVIYWNYVHDGVPKVAKERVEAIDDVNNSTSFRVIEGDILNEYKDFLITVQATPKGQGSLVKWTFEYEKLKPDVPDPQSLLNFVVTVSKGIDDHHTTTTAAA